MMPKGVEHALATFTGFFSNSVKIPMMPKGVEYQNEMPSDVL